MLYVLIGLVVALALISGAEYAMLRIEKAEHKAEVAKLKADIVKCQQLAGDIGKLYAEAQDRLHRLENVREGIEE